MTDSAGGGGVMLLYASGGILFANSGKKYAKNAAKNKVLDSFAADKRGICRTWPKLRIVSATAPLRQPIPDHYAAANRDTSSKPPRFIRHWRRFGDFLRRCR